tara:strand:- start:323 stop:1177 length:855 start_codon:yes stop_codon:yes gene_type:complete
MKLAIGTAQWGMEYGINNSLGIVKDCEIEKMKSFLIQENITMIDSARSYGNSEKKIGKLFNNDFKIVSKFGNVNKFGSIKDQLDHSLRNLKLKFIYGYLFHDTKELINNLKLWDDLKSLKEMNRVKKIGFSIYEINDLEYLIENKCIPDIIQLPYNILDRKFEKYLPNLKKMNIEIHARSIFIQGLVFMELSHIDNRLKVLKKPLKLLKKIASDSSNSLDHIALQYVLLNNYIDYMVIGFDNFIQLKQIVNKLNKPINNDIFKKIKKIELNKIEKKYINPSNWN